MVIMCTSHVVIMCCLCSAANKCMMKVATLCSNMQQFEKASGIFEEVGV